MLNIERRKKLNFFRTIDPKVPKRAPRRGVQTPLCQKTGSHMKKKQIFRPKFGFFGAKKKGTPSHHVGDDDHLHQQDRGAAPHL